jgi:serine/threonine protein kinase
VLVAEGEHCYLTDFGITKELGGRADLTSPGAFVGTIDYTAPEQIRGEPVGPAADLYALGCLLFEALTGHVPFRGETDAAVALAHVEAPPPRTGDPDLTRFEPVLARALAKRPQDRFPDASAFAAAVERAAEASPDPPPEPAARPPARVAHPPETSEPTQPA